MWDPELNEGQPRINSLEKEVADLRRENQGLRLVVHALVCQAQRAGDGGVYLTSRALEAHGPGSALERVDMPGTHTIFFRCLEHR